MRITFKACLLASLVVAGCSSETAPWVEAEGYRWRSVSPKGKSAGFEPMSAAATGITFTNTLSDEDLIANRHRMHGSGVAIGDVNGDSLPDVYLAGLSTPNALHLNRGGWRFEEAAEAAGVAAAGQFSTGAVLEDIDGDYDLDLLLTTFEGVNTIYLNDGNGQFQAAPPPPGLVSGRGSTTMALADTDLDGDLDLYIANYKRIALKDSLPPDQIAWERVVLGQNEDSYINPAFADHYQLNIRGTKLIRLETAEPDQFFLNDGAGNFNIVEHPSSIFLDDEGLGRDWALTARFHDVNDDGAPDLYVCNDFESPDFFWINDGTGRFTKIDALSLRKTSNASMAVDFSDIDRDGDIDFFVADMLGMDDRRRKIQRNTQIPLPAEIGVIDDRPQYMQNTLMLNQGDGTYAEIAQLSGVAASDWTWASAFMDVDLDGYEDLLVTNGHAYDVQNGDAQQREQMQIRQVRSFEGYRRLILDFPPLDLPNMAYRNRGDLTFETIPDGWGIGQDPDVSHGIALGDLDGDGDLDAVINRLGEPAGVFQNTAPSPRIGVLLKGEGGNTRGIGSKIMVEGGPVAQQKEVTSGGMYLSGSDVLASFAASPEQPHAIEVKWQSGSVSRIENAQANRVYQVFEADAGPPLPAEPEAVPTPFFDARPINLSHTEAPFSDFARQPLLPHRLSQSGPGIAMADVDLDGDVDLVAGSGKGSGLSYFQNIGGQLQDASRLIPSNQLTDDATGIVAIPSQNGVDLLIGITNFEQPPGAISYLQHYRIQGNHWEDRGRIEVGESSVGALSAADVDGDGDLDVFAAGYAIPGHYPAQASSHIFLNEDGYFIRDPQRSTPFDRLGLVWGSAFADVDADGDQDLALTLDWDAPHLFLNDGRGQYSDATAAWGLAAFDGWWRGLTWGDVNNDGRLDLIASNRGWNSPYGRGGADSLRIYAGDYDGNGITDALLSRYEPRVGEMVPITGWPTLSEAMPYLRRRVRGFEAYSESSLENILGVAINQAAYKEANMLGHHVFINEGGRFTGRPLPVLSQIAPGYGLVLGDFTGSGCEDIVLAQNFFAEPIDVPRSDAGQSVLLQGDCQGGFEVLPANQSGLRVYGEQRGIGAGDLDQDGRPELLFSQNGADFKLFSSASPVENITISLSGPSGNRWGIGSVIRIVYTDGSRGAARVVSAGTGYWSQHAAAQLLGIDAEKTPEAVEITWPNGEIRRTSIEAGATVLSVTFGVD